MIDLVSPLLLKQTPCLPLTHTQQTANSRLIYPCEQERALKTPLLSRPCPLPDPGSAWVNPLAEGRSAVMRRVGGDRRKGFRGTSLNNRRGMRESVPVNGMRDDREGGTST